jgi:hypothetical protein
VIVSQRPSSRSSTMPAGASRGLTSVSGSSNVGSLPPCPGR